MLRIGFYGHSICSNAAPGTYIRSIVDYFNATLVNKGTGRGSEERILFELKKSTPDIAIVFHSQPKYLFVPNFPRDIDANDNVILDESIDMVNNKFNVLSNTEPSSAWSDEERMRKDINSFPKCVELFKKHLYHQDLQMNRFQGALLLLDDYCLNKKLITLHIPVVKFIPPWFKFKSGRVLHELEQYVIKKDRPLNTPNGLSDEDNKVVGDFLINVINQELSAH